MRCTHCGSDNPDNLKYCIKCGKPLASGRKSAVSAAGEDAASELDGKMSRADKKSARTRQRAKAQAAKRVKERPSVEPDDNAVKRAQERQKARRAAASSAAASGHAARTTVASGLDDANTVETIRSPRPRQRGNTDPSVSGAMIPAVQTEKDSSRAAVYNYGGRGEKKSRKGIVAAIAAAAALATGSAWVAVNGNPFDGGDTTKQVSSAASSSVSSVGSNAASSMPSSTASSQHGTFENDAFSISLPERWKDKVLFQDNNGNVEVKDKASGTTMAELFVGDVPEQQVAGQRFDIGKAMVGGEEKPVTLFVPNVDDQGVAIPAGSEGGKSALEHYLNVAPSTFVSYVKTKQSDGFKTASIGAPSTTSSAEQQNASGSGSMTGAEMANGVGTGTGYTIVPGEGNTEYNNSGSPTELPTQSPQPAPAPEPEPAPAPEPEPAPEPSVQPSGSSPFWGVWIGAFRSADNAQKRVAEAAAQGLDATVLVSNEWSNLNPNALYVVTVGTYGDEASARAVLTRAKTAGFTDAYVKYTGNHK